MQHHGSLGHVALPLAHALRHRGRACGRGGGGVRDARSAAALAVVVAVVRRHVRAYVVGGFGLLLQKHHYCSVRLF